MSEATGERLTTGVAGLDEVLDGGLPARRSYMVRGEPGTGKSILGLEFLAAGTRRSETALFVALEETESELRRNAASLGLAIEDVDVLDLTPASTAFTDDATYDVFEPDEVDGGATVDRIVERVRETDPDRVVIDPLTQLRYLAPDDYQFRTQVLGLTRFFGGRGATLLFTSQAGAGADPDLQFMADGVIEMHHGATGRTVDVPKLRGSDSRSGVHAMRIESGGLSVYPELRPGDQTEFEHETVSSGVPALDEQLHGGIERGTVTIVAGPTGVGKTTTGAQFMKEAAGRGERSKIYMFEETERTFLQRCSAVNIPVERMLERGTLSVETVEALERSPQEFAHGVRHDVEANDTRIVMIDGVDGYDLSIRGDEADLRRQLHRLCRYLKRRGVTVVLVATTGSVTGEFRVSEAGVSYLADSVLFLRHIEMEGELRKVIGVLKKRTSGFEHTLREFEITEHGIKIGDPLGELRGILGGTPELTDRDGQS
jgi:circadian clock protein KaiC